MERRRMQISQSLEQKQMGNQMKYGLTREQRQIAMDPKKTLPLSNDSGLDHHK